MNSLQNGEQLALRDLHLPDPITWWPPAPGWWWLGLILAICILCIAIVYRQRDRRRTRKALQHAVLELSEHYQRNPDPKVLVESLSVLIRRASLTYFPREQVAALTGESWLTFLDQGASGNEFSQGVGRALIEAPYRPTCQIDGDALITLTRQWLKALPAVARQQK
ncbi:MAG: DUF4381 domain-containing protein [Gammaproteobacteria bacterium]|nr:DUF4381 domain-containing protein [Gammaproteobacteria bacterium]